jgi:ADP-ribose pyrophosphatase
MSQSEPLRVLAEGKFTRLVAQGHWEWVQRVNVSGGVVVLPITADRQVVLVRQYRIPLHATVLELPAGLAGDNPGAAGEALIEAARRELLEETGYAASRWQWLLEGPSSAGLTNESFHLFLAQDARKVAPGGGDASEQIEVIVTPLEGIDAWLAAERRAGLVIDPKIYTGLYFVD